MNNKGFAITGILYTLFILFLLILASVLAGLHSQKTMLEQSIYSLEKSYTGKQLTATEIATIRSNGIATVNGKYIFQIEGIDTQCTSYLTKGTNLTEQSITFVTKDCNDYTGTMILTNVFDFETAEEE